MSEVTTIIDTAAMISFLRKLAADLKSPKIEAIADRLEEQNTQLIACEAKINSIAKICSED